MVNPYASADMVRLYVRKLSEEISDDDINLYTLGEDRMTVDVALANGLGLIVPLTSPPDVIKTLSAKCSALAIMRAIYGASTPTKADYNNLKAEVEQFLMSVRTGELIL